MTPLLLPLHGIGSRQDLPLPFEYVLAGSALALLVSFAVLGFAWRSPRWQSEPAGLALPRISRGLRNPVVAWAARLLVLAGWLSAAAGLWFGQDRVTNPAFGYIYVWLWVGLVPLSVLAGPIWRWVNPARTLLDLLALVPVIGRRLDQDRLSVKVGLWPGATALLAFLWLELVQPDNNSLPVVQRWALVWTVWVLGGALLAGRAWIAAADPFEVLATLVARLSPWRWCEGKLHLVNPLHNAAAGPHPAGTAAVVVVLLGGTAFDSFGATSGWIKLVQLSEIPSPIWGSLGLAAMVLLVAVTFRIGVLNLGADRMAASVIPIVIGYSIGHYLSLLVLEGQRTGALLSDPLGLGWNIFGTAETGIAMLWLDNPTATALVQLAAILGGHLLGVLLAHDLAITGLPARYRLTGQLPLLLVMISYTIGGLTLLFSP